MQKSFAATPTASVPGARVAIIQACWHAEHTNKVVTVCSELLAAAGCIVETFFVPGSYELPLATKKIAQSRKFEAIVVVGAVIKGDTDHYTVIIDTCAREIGRVMYEFEIPIVMELLPVHSLEQLISRTEGDHNKGIEAAHAALEIMSFYRKLPARLV